MEFSIIVAVRNENSYIERCIESLYNQKFKGEYEIIVVDGMSDDGTYETLKKIKKKYKIKLFQNPVLNAAAGRNLGIKKSKGTYIAFIDGDAIAEKDWLSQIKKCFEKNDVSGVGGPDLLPDDSTNRSRMIAYVMTSPLARGGKINPSTQHSLMDKEKLVDHIPTCNLTLKKDVFDKVGVFDEAFVKGQDLELNYRVRKAGLKLLYSPNVKVVHYRKHHTRDFSSQIYKWAKAKVAIIKKHGMQGLISHVYLWPLYFLTSFILASLIFFFSGLLRIYMYLIFIAIIIYITVSLMEALSLSIKYKSKFLFWFALPYFPVIHIMYAWGVIFSFFRKKIW